MSYITPKLWRPGEALTPVDFNAYQNRNFIALLERDTDIETYVAGGTDVTWVNTTLAAHPDLTSLGLIVPTRSNVLFMWTGIGRVGTTAGRLLAYDIHWVEEDKFLSSMTATPITNGLAKLRSGAIAQNLHYSFSWLQPDVPEGTHTFELYVRVSGDTAAEERSAGYGAFSALVL